MLKPGYKKTDIGVLPEEWEVQPLGDSLTRKPDYGINAAAVPYSSILPVYLRITDISEKGGFLSHNKTSVSHPAARAFILQENDIVFARTGASTGKSYLYDPNDGELVFAGFLIRVQTNQNKLDARFLKAFVQTTPYWKWVATTSVRSGQPGINGVEYSQLQIPLPPLAEQQAIADTLGAVDALLREQRALLAKKRDLKLATQTALLTRARRLPGFTGEWQERTLGELFSFLSTGNNSRSELTSHGEIGYLHYGDIHTKFHDFLDCKTGKLPFLPKEKARNLMLLQEGDLIISDASEDYEGVGKGVEIQSILGRKIVAGLHTHLLRGDKNKVVNGFKGYIPTMPKTRQFLHQMATGVTVYGLSKSNIKDAPVDLPPPNEQRAIAQILSSMAAELAALAAQLAKTEALKQGLMQDLLTGTIRLRGAGPLAPIV